MIKTITFDLDDTLWPVWPAIGRAETAMYSWLNEHAPEISRRFSPDQLLELRNRFAAEKQELSFHISLLRMLTMREVAMQCGYDPAIGEQAFEVMWRERNRVDLYDDVIPTLRQLRGMGVRLGALSNGNADLREVGLSDWFDFALNAVSARQPKPASRMFQLAVEQSCCQPEEIIHVGDDVSSDVLGAKALGLIAVWLDRTGEGCEGEEGAAENADFVIHSLSQLPGLVEALNRSG